MSVHENLRAARKRASHVRGHVEDLLHNIMEHGMEPHKTHFLCKLCDFADAWYNLRRALDDAEHSRIHYNFYTDGDRDMCYVAGSLRWVVYQHWGAAITFVMSGDVSNALIQKQNEYNVFYEEMEQALIQRELTS